MIELTKRAKDELHSDEVLVFDWPRIAICCAAAGEVSLRRFSSDLPPDFGLRSVPGRPDQPM